MDYQCPRIPREVDINPSRSLVLSDQLVAKRRAVEDALDPTGAPEPPPRKKAKPKAYVPALRTGPYAIILALSTVDEGSSIGISKTQLIDLAQPLCDASFTAPPDPSKF